MIVVKLQHRTHLMQASQVNSVSSDVFNNSVNSDEGYSGEVRTKESSGIWDNEW